MRGERIGYVRVSSFDQNPGRQLDQVQVDKLFTQKASGKDTQRPQLDALLSFVRKGDTAVVHSMDRLARNLDDLRRLMQTLTKRGTRIEFFKECLSFTGEDSPMANLRLSVIGAFAEFERTLIGCGNAKGLHWPSSAAPTEVARKRWWTTKLSSCAAALVPTSRNRSLRVSSASVARRCINT